MINGIDGLKLDSSSGCESITSCARSSNRGSRSSCGLISGYNGLESDVECIRAVDSEDPEVSVDELAAYFDLQLHIPRKMSYMAELMYT